MHDPHGFERPPLLIDYSAGGTRYVLPRRQLGRIRHVGWILFGMGGFVTLFMIGWMWLPITSGIEELQQKQTGGWLSIAFGCAGILGLVPALGLLLAGIAIAFNRTSCVVDVRDGVLRTQERFLLARWRRKRAAQGIVRLRVSLASEWKDEAEPRDVSEWLGDSEAALVAEMADGQEFLVAVVYPRELLLQLAADLAARVEAETMTMAAVIDRDPLDMTEERPATKKVEVFEGPPAEDKLLVPPQPADSVATIERRPYGITIDIPPVGIWKGSRGLMFFAILWNGIVGMALVMMTLSMTGAIEMEGDKPDLFMLLFMIPFVAVGVGVTLAAVNMGRRHATIATADNLVMIVRHSLFGKTTKEWSADAISEICMGNSGMEVNDVPVKELQIHARNSSKFGCLSQLDADELAWIAGELNLALTLAPESKPAGDYDERDESGRVVPAQWSRIVVNDAINGASILVPSLGLRRNLAGLIFGLVFMGIAGGIATFGLYQVFENGLKGGELFILAFLSLFVLVFGGAGALAFFTSLLSVALRFQITADRHQLTVIRRGFIFRRTFAWERGLLEPITVASSGVKVNDRTHYHVSIASPKGDSLRIMSGYDRSDLEFVAAAINEAMGLAEGEEK